MEIPQAEELADLADAVVEFLESCRLPCGSTNIRSRTERILTDLGRTLRIISLKGMMSVNSPVLQYLTRCKKAVETVQEILNQIATVSDLISETPHPWVKECEGALDMVLEELSDSTNVLSLVIEAGSCLENPSAISQAEAEKRIYDELMQNVLGAGSQMFPSIKRPTIRHESFTIEEIDMVKNSQSSTAGSSTIICPRACIDATFKKTRNKVKFSCRCNNSPHESQLDYKVFRGKSLLREEIGIDGSRQWSALLLSSNKPVIVRLLNAPPLGTNRVQSVADDIGMAYVAHQDDSISKPYLKFESGRFECFQNDWGFPSTKVDSLTYELGGVKRSLGNPSKVMLKHYSMTPNFLTTESLNILASRYPLPDRYYQIILEKNSTVTGGKIVLGTTQTQICHEENPLGRLFVTLENVFLVGGEKAGEKREMCHVHFGFDDRRDAQCFAHYLNVARETWFEKFMRGPLHDEKVIYFRDTYAWDSKVNPTHIQFSILSREFGDLRHARRAILTQTSNEKRCFCFEFESTASDVKEMNLPQSRIWVYDHDENNKLFIFETDWDTLNTQGVIRPIKRNPHH
ncbi:hypothetical protein FPOAC2_03669 [Fusarium poae]